MTRGSRGLTVIETLIAATLFLTSVVVLVGLYPASARATRQSQGHLMATFLAERELEFARGRGYDTLTDYSETYDLNVSNNGVSHDINFTTTVTVVDVRDGLKSVTVSVDYLAPDKFNRQLKMETYVGKSTPAP
jgi:Tfp pilus assembly protein PilV